MTIKEMIEKYMSAGFTNAQARSYAAQQIILSKIEQSEFADRILLKGGVVMYNITQEQRRTTLDLDFDFVRYDISNESITKFIELLDRKKPEYHVDISGKIENLHQQDYKGKRVKISISDETRSIKFKIDVGVHTLLAIKQNKMCFSFSDDDKLFLLVNPPEQIFSEKLFSLAKVGRFSQRFRDIDDMYYLIVNKNLDIALLKQCLELLTVNHPYGIANVQDVIDKVKQCLNDSFFVSNYNENNGSWLGIDFNKAKEEIITFIYKI